MSLNTYIAPISSRMYHLIRLFFNFHYNIMIIAFVPTTWRSSSRPVWSAKPLKLTSSHTDETTNSLYKWRLTALIRICEESSGLRQRNSAVARADSALCNPELTDDFEDLALQAHLHSESNPGTLS